MTRLIMVGALLASVSLLAARSTLSQGERRPQDASGKSLGEAILEQQDGAVEISATLTGLRPGEHPLHHEVGRCDPPFDSAGGHFNPDGKKHGKDNPRDLTRATAEPRRAEFRAREGPGGGQGRVPRWRAEPAARS